ncbi:hypothetical protein [Arthrobacter sp. D3-16]
MSAGTKMPPPISATSTMARGTVRRGLMVSSVRVVTASNPRNEYAAMAAPTDYVSRPQRRAGK